MLSNIKYRGYLYALLGAFIFSSEGIFIRLISLETPSIIYFQGVFATIIISSILLSSKNSRLFRPKSTFRGIIIVSASMIIIRLFFFQSLKLIPIAISVFLFYLFPLQVVILSYFFLKEKISKKILVSLLSAFSGVILILLFQETQFTFTNYLGYILALISSFASAILALSIKKYLTEESSYTVAFYIHFLSILVFQMWMLFEGGFSKALLFSDFSLLVLFSIVGVVGTLLMIQALKYIKAQEYSILAYFEPLSAYLLGALILQQYLKVTSILGGVLICMGGILIFLRTD